MNEIPVDPIQNTAIPPIDAITTPPVINELPKKRNYLFWLLGILVLVVVLAVSFLILTSKSKSTPIERNGEAAFILYESKKFGVSFKYDGRLGIKETGNSIIVDDLKGLGKDPHYLIKIFKKSPNDTLEEVINKTLLANYKRLDCFAILSKVNPIHPDYISAEINYPPDKNPQDESNLPNCDSAYYKTNGARVFWMDLAHPDKFIFIDAGQSVIYSSGDIDWPSFKFLD